ncbi:hypothetical protein [Aeromicrobium sp. HA]|uniref:hypothetical protein n=1 Tax=Aeromicrobium sp. HA TaxID=3009077 RepID=UPI0022AEFDB8|nr:hypothetical protein [Aeromicrobium sp. HA]
MRLLAALALGLVLSACSGGGDEKADEPKAPAASSTPTQAADEAGLKEAATEISARFASQDFGGTWAMFDKASRDAVPRDGYVEMGEVCEYGGAPLEVTSVRLEGGDAGIARVGIAGFEQSLKFVYEDGAWAQEATKTTKEFFAPGGGAEDGITEADC